MRDEIDRLSALRPPERDRLERFAKAFEHLDAGAYAQFSGVPSAAGLESAQDEAMRLVGTGSRREAVKAAVRAFVDEATVAYARRMSLPDTFLLFQSLPDRAEDRVRFLGSVERAVVALVLWDELSEQSLAALLGPWAELVDRAMPEERP